MRGKSGILLNIREYMEDFQMLAVIFYKRSFKEIQSTSWNKILNIKFHDGKQMLYNSLVSSDIGDYQL